MAKHHSVLSVETFKLEGTLFVPDVLQRVFQGALDRDYAYAVPAGLSLADEYGRAFRIAVASWRHFLARREAEPQAAQRRFLKALFHDALGYDLAESAEGQVPFRLAGPGTIPIYYSWFGDDFDATAPRFSGDGLSRRKRSVTQFAQEWLNERDDCLWTIVTNGRLVRLLRENNSLTRPSWIEFDLERILSEERYADFTFFWRLFYRDRAGALGSGEDSVWEKLHARGEEEGVRVFNDLRDGVVKALLHLGNGFLADTRNAALRAAVDAGEISDGAFFEELLRVAYRFLFLFSAEERKALLAPAPDSPADAGTVYWEGYSLHRLIRRARRASAYDRNVDLWEGVKIVFNALAEGEGELALPALGGLFRRGECPYLMASVLDNRTLLGVMSDLRWTQVNGAYQLVDYRNLGAEELGSVYESLLELVPTIARAEKTFGFVGLTEEGLTSGNARKTSGSYYTPSCLVDELVRSTVDPLVKARLQGKVTQGEQEQAILSISVLDPSCGSGHFVLAAARRLAEALARARAGEAEAVTGEGYRAALRDVVSTCVYGTDLNPMALELAKIALWIETLVPGRPLGFLDSHFVCGNSVLGISQLAQLEKGIPPEAFDAVGADDKTLVKTLGAANNAALRDLKRNPGAVSLFTRADPALAAQRAAIEALPAGSVAEIEAKAKAWNDFYAAERTNRLYAAADLYTAAFLETKDDPSREYPDTAKLRAFLAGDTLNAPKPETLAEAARVAADAKALHWPLVFPTVFAKGGFDIVLANPPWDRIKIQAKEFFATRYPAISEAKNAATRNRLIAALGSGGAAERKLLSDFNAAVALSDRTSAFAHATDGHYPLTGVGDVNLYALFVELITQITAPTGRAGIVCPTGICTDNSTQAMFNALVKAKRLESLYDFENRQKLFPAVDSRYKFALLTLGQSERPDFAFFSLHPRDLADARRHFSLTAEEFALVNPNTLTAPVCRSGYDAELTKKIYRAAGVLVKEGDATHPDINPWGVSYQRLFDMSNDSNQFRDAPGDDLFPLYEAKMMHIYDHRWATFPTGAGEPVDATAEQKADPAFEVRPEYWVSKRATYVRLADVPGNLYKAAKKWDVAAMRVALANWAIRAVPCATIGDDANVRELFGDVFAETLPTGWKAKTFDTTTRRPLTREELCGAYDDAWFEAFLAARSPKYLMGFRDITNAANSRTDILAVFPIGAVGNTISLLLPQIEGSLLACFVADTSSLVHDWAVRQKIGGVHLNMFYKSQVSNLPPSAYAQADIDFIVLRVLELTYTSQSLKPWAEALGYAGEPYTFDEARRGVLKAELDVFFAKKYGLTEEEFRYILDPADVKGADFPSESFRTLRDDEISRYGEYRTKRLALEAWERMKA